MNDNKKQENINLLTSLVCNHFPLYLMENKFNNPVFVKDILSLFFSNEHIDTVYDTWKTHSSNIQFSKLPDENTAALIPVFYNIFQIHYSNLNLKKCFLSLLKEDFETIKTITLKTKKILSQHNPNISITQTLKVPHVLTQIRLDIPFEEIKNDQEFLQFSIQNVPRPSNKFLIRYLISFYIKQIKPKGTHTNSTQELSHSLTKLLDDSKTMQYLSDSIDYSETHKEMLDLYFSLMHQDSNVNFLHHFKKIFETNPNVQKYARDELVKRFPWKSSLQLIEGIPIIDSNQTDYEPITISEEYHLSVFIPTRYICKILTNQNIKSTTVQNINEAIFMNLPAQYHFHKEVKELDSQILFKFNSNNEKQQFHTFIQEKLTPILPDLIKAISEEKIQIDSEYIEKTLNYLNLKTKINSNSVSKTTQKI